MGATKIINISKNDDFEEVFDLFKNTDAEEVIFIFPRGSRFTKQEQYFEAIKREADSSGKRASIMTADPVISQFASKYDFDILEARSTGPVRSKSPLATARPNFADLQNLGGQASSPPASEEVSDEQLLSDQPEPFIREFPVEVEADYPGSFGEEGEDIIEKDIIGEEPALSQRGRPETILAAATDKEAESGGPASPKTASQGGRGGRGRVIKDIFPPRTDRSLEIKEEKERTFEVDIKSRIGVEGPRQQAADIGRIWAEEERKERQNLLVSSARKLRPSKLFKKMPLLLIISAVLVLILVIFSTFGNARVIIRPQKQNLDFKLKISASSTATAVNFDLNQIPGQRFKEQKEKSDVFPVSGWKDVVQKASGRITIFNKSSASQRLVATTRFKSPDGLIFRIPQTITVPAAFKARIVTTPGSVSSAVYADRPGAEYNIGPTQFTIPGFEGTPKFNDFYAVSDKPMTGGIIGPAKVITEEDFAKAQETLAAGVKNEILQSLKSQSGELKILEANVIKLEAPVTNVKVGDAAENLQMSIKGSADTVAFRESDVVELIKNFVLKKDGLELLSKDLDISYLNPVPDKDGTSLSFDVKINGQAVFRLDKEAILKDVAGMNEDSVRSYFKDIKEVESARIILSPFWVKSIPKDIAKIRIDLVK